MPQYFYQLIAPTLTDTVNARRQYFMSIGLLLFLGVSLIYSVFLLTSRLQGGADQFFILNPPYTFISTLLAYALVRKGHLDRAWHWLSFILFASQSYFILTRGLAPSHLLLLFLPVLITGTLLNLKIAGLYWVGGLAVYGYLSWSPNALYTSESLLNLLVSSFMYFIFIIVYRQGIRSTIAHDQASSRQLAEHFERLEAEVAARTRELKTLTEELQSSESRYRSLVELSPEGVCVHDGRTILFINQTGSRLLGGNHPSEFIGKPVLELVLQEMRECAGQQIERILGDEILKRVESKLIRRDGTLLDVSVTAGPIHYNDKAAVQFIFRDITEWKQAQDELQLHRDRERATLDALPDLMFVIDSNLTYLDYRAEQSELLARQPSDFLGRTIYEVLPPLWQPRWAKLSKKHWKVTRLLRLNTF